MNKYIGFDKDSKKTVACALQKRRKGHIYEQWTAKPLVIHGPISLGICRIQSIIT